MLKSSRPGIGSADFCWAACWPPPQPSGLFGMDRVFGEGRVKMGCCPAKRGRAGVALSICVCMFMVERLRLFVFSWHHLSLFQLRTFLLLLRTFDLLVFDLFILKVPKESIKDKDESAENPSQTKCKYYSRSGGCKYGENWKYSHSKGKLELNFLGLPIRPGKRECPYYIRNGSCKYALNCRFNHPDPTATGGSDPPSGYGNGGPASLQGASQSTVAPWSAPRPLNEDPVYSTLMIPPPQVVSSQNSEWNGYQASAYAPERSMPARPPYMMNNSVAETNVYKQHPHQNQVEEFLERPGQPLCSYFLRKGYCKFKSNCKYDHPKTQCSRPPNRTQ